MASSRSQVASIGRATRAAAMLEEDTLLARRALALRQRGKSWFQIAETLKLPEARAKGLAGEAITAAAKLVSDGVRAEYLAMEVQRLDILMDALWDDAMAGDISAAREIRGNIMDRAKLLGLDEQIQTGPVRTVIINGHSEEYQEALRLINSGEIG